MIDSSLQRWFTRETIKRRPDLIDRVTKIVLGDDPAVHAAIWDSEVRCRRSSFVGERDPSAPLSAASSLRRGLQAKMLVIPVTSHMVTVESQDTVNAALGRLLAAH